MAKVTGPLMSMDASGAFGGALVFGKWKGRNTVRQLVIPANPQTADQETARNRTRVTGAIQNFFNSTALVADGQTETDKVRIQLATPGTYAWNGYLTQTIIGKGGIAYDTAVAAYAALTAPQKAAWTSAAEALSPTMLDVHQTAAGGVASTPMDAGEVWFIAQFGLSLMGLAATPTGTPPTYA